MDTHNIVKGIHEDMAEAIDHTMPRQAIVTRVDDPGVWVRFTPVDTNAPELWLPSNVASPKVGTAGWVHPLAGGKGRFIADNVKVPVPIVRGSAHVMSPSMAINTAGDYTIPASPTSANSLVLFTGLQPGVNFRLAWSATYGAWVGGGTPDVRWAVRIVHGGGTVFNGYPGATRVLAAGENAYHWNHSQVVTATASGEVSICPAVRWSAGDTRILWSTLSATLSEE